MLYSFDDKLKKLINEKLNMNYILPFLIIALHKLIKNRSNSV